MKKKLCSKLTLSRETVSVLASEAMVEVHGGVKTLGPTCPATTCITCHEASVCEAC